MHPRKGEVSGMRLISLLTALILAVPLASSVPASPKCGRAQARNVILRFVREYNAGDWKSANALVAGPDKFIRYRVGPVEREFPMSDDRPSLKAYFQSRSSHKDSMELIDLRLSKQRQGEGWGMTFEVARTSDDPLPRSEGSFIGKGLVDCKIVAWNMGPKP